MSTLVSNEKFKFAASVKSIDEINVDIVEKRDHYRSLKYFKDYVEQYVAPKRFLLSSQQQFLDLRIIEPVYFDLTVDANKIYFGEFTVTVTNYPLCLAAEDRNSYCNKCDFSSKQECVFHLSDDLFSTVFIFYQAIWKNYHYDKTTKLEIINALHKQLLMTKGPVHYQDLTNQVRKKNLGLHLIPRSVYRLMAENPSRFSRYSPGWYIAI